MTKTGRFLLSILVLAMCRTAAPARAGEPAILNLRDQARVVDGWLRTRLDTILPEIMRREKIDMWLVICKEYNEDPVYRSLVPFEDLSARRLSMLVFFDKGAAGVERFAVSRYGVGDLFPTVWDPAREPDQWKCLAEAVRARKPKRIGIDESDTFAFGDGLTSVLKRRLVEALGPEWTPRLTSAERLAVGWLERRSPEEIETYPQIVAIAHAIIAEAFSRNVVTPGATTSDDVAWWMRERIRGLGLETWFHPDISIQRPKSSPYRGDVIHRGDVLHCDMGIAYLRLNTDTQQMAYVLREGEEDAPKGLRDALAQGNRLQDIHLAEMKEGRTGNAMLAPILKKAVSEGLTPSVYTHALGVHGHAAGPVIGYWDKQEGVPGLGDYPLYRDTVHSIELNVRASVPEWGNEEIRIALEEDAVFGKGGASWLDGRQTKFHLIR
ncbi:MAG: M24 family metallopeptidase [Candidatus Aminicenantales bacterium]